MELTREKVEDWLSRTERGGLFGSNIVSDLCTALLAEMDKPKVWDGAPEWATDAYIQWSAKTHYSGVFKSYARELPKSRERQIAEELSGDTETSHPIINGIYAVDVIEQALLKYKAELEAGR